MKKQFTVWFPLLISLAACPAAVAQEGTQVTEHSPAGDGISNI